jgi:hypothetical protein
MHRTLHGRLAPLALAFAIIAAPGCSDTSTAPQAPAEAETISTPTILRTASGRSLSLSLASREISDGRGHTRKLSPAAFAAAQKMFQRFYDTDTMLAGVRASKGFQNCLRSGQASGRVVRSRLASVGAPNAGPTRQLAAAVTSLMGEPVDRVNYNGSYDDGEDGGFAILCQDLSMAIYEKTKLYNDAQNVWAGLIAAALVSGVEISADGFFYSVSSTIGVAAVAAANLAGQTVMNLLTTLNILVVQWHTAGCANVYGESYRPSGNSGRAAPSGEGCIEHLYLEQQRADGGWDVIWEGDVNIC